MKDKDSKLIWESFTNEATGDEAPEVKGPPLTVLGSAEELVAAAKENPKKYMYHMEYPDHWDEDRCEREIAAEYRGGEMDRWNFEGEEDPWGETDGERHTREVEFTSEKSLEYLQGLLPKLNEDQLKYLQSALYDVVGAINDMVGKSEAEARKKELTDFAYDGPER